MNTTLTKIIVAYQQSTAGTAHDEESGGVDFVDMFIHDDDSKSHLSITVTSNSSPLNLHQFLIHLVLSLGKYDTAISALTHLLLCASLTTSCLIVADDDLAPL